MALAKKVEAIVAVGNDVNASLEAGVASLSLSGASFGLQTNDSGTVFEFKGSAFAATIPLTTITASSALVQYTDTTGMAANTTLSVGAVDYTFEQEILSNTVAFNVMDLDANVADFVALGGDFGFKKEGGTNIAVGNNVSASLEAGIVSLSLSGASFGLQTGDSGTVFELKDGAFAATIPGLASITASSTLIRYADASGSMSANATLSVWALIMPLLKQLRPTRLPLT